MFSSELGEEAMLSSTDMRPSRDIRRVRKYEEMAANEANAWKSSVCREDDTALFASTTEEFDVTNMNDDEIVDEAEQIEKVSESILVTIRRACKPFTQTIIYAISSLTRALKPIPPACTSTLSNEPRRLMIGYGISNVQL